MIAGSEDERARARRVAAVCARAYAAGRDAMARRDFDLARTAFRWARRADPGNPAYIHAEARLAECTGNFHEAERLYRRVIDLALRAFGECDPRTAMAQAGLVRLYERADRYDEARKLAARIVDGLDRRAAARCSINALSRIGGICVSADRPDDAMLIHWQACTYRRTVFGRGHAKAVECLAATNAFAARLKPADGSGTADRQVPSLALTPRASAVQEAWRSGVTSQQFRA